MMDIRRDLDERFPRSAFERSLVWVGVSLVLGAVGLVLWWVGL